MSAGPRQLPLPLPERRALGRDSLIVSPANAAALAMVERWRDWPNGRLAVSGPEGAGKTHLVHVWRALSGAEAAAAAELTPGRAEALAAAPAVAVEDADRIADLVGPARAAAEEGLFHLHNLIGAAGGALLVTGRSAPARWRIALPDLASRLAAMAHVEIGAPDDALLSSLLAKLLADRQIRPAEGLIPFLLRRIERSSAAAEAVIAKLDARAMEERAELTVPFARRVLGPADGAPAEESE